MRAAINTLLATWIDGPFDGLTPHETEQWWIVVRGMLRAACSTPVSH